MSNSMQKFEDSEIKFNPSYFDINTIQSFIKQDLPSLSLQSATQILPSISQPLDLEKTGELNGDEELVNILDQVSAQIQTDQDFNKITTEQLAKLKTEASESIQSSFTSIPSAELIKNNQESLVVNAEENSDYIVYSINGTIVLEIPLQEKNTKLGVSLEMLLAWTFLIWHSVSFIATVASIWMPKAQGSAVNGVSKVVEKSSSKWSKFVNAMKSIKDKVEASEKVATFIYAFKQINVMKQLYAVVKAIMSKLKWYEIALAVLEFVGTVALLFVTAGASLVAKMIKLAVNLVQIVQDVIKILKLEDKLGLRPERELIPEPA